MSNHDSNVKEIKLKIQYLMTSKTRDSLNTDLHPANILFLGLKKFEERHKINKFQFFKTSTNPSGKIYNK